MSGGNSSPVCMAGVGGGVVDGQVGTGGHVGQEIGGGVEQGSQVAHDVVTGGITVGGRSSETSVRKIIMQVVIT